MRFFTFIFSLFLYIVSNKKKKTTIYCGLWRTHRESNPELTLRRGLFYPLNYECKLRILRKLVNDMAFSKTLPKTLPIFYSVVKNARYLAFFGLKSPIFAHFCWIHLALRSGNFDLYRCKRHTNSFDCGQTTITPTIIIDTCYKINTI